MEVEESIIRDKRPQLRYGLEQNDKDTLLSICDYVERHTYHYNRKPEVDEIFCRYLDSPDSRQ